MTIQNDRTPEMELNDLLEKGHQAIKLGDTDESLKWYMEGLAKAREFKNQEKAKLFSHLLMLFI